MAAIGIGMVYLGYSLGLWGFCLVKGYDVSLKELFSPTWPPPKGKAPTQKTPATPKKKK